MRSENIIEDIINDEFLEAVENLRENSSSFMESVALLNLDPQKDFRHCDLSYTRIDHADLRGFDFTGADLRGLHGKNIRWDSTTIFDDALLEDSLFTLVTDRQNFFKNNPEWHAEYNRISSDYWANRIVKISDAIQQHGSDSADLFEVLKALFDQESNRVVKTEILYYMSPALNNSSKHKNFLIHTLFRSEHDEITKGAALQVLCSFYRNDESASRILYSIAMDHSESLPLRKKSALAVMDSKYYSNILTNFENDNTLWDAETRKKYLIRKAETLGNIYVRSVLTRKNEAIDFADPITARTVSDIASHSLIREPYDDSETRKRRQSFEAEIRSRLLRLYEAGVPFTFS